MQIRGNVTNPVNDAQAKRATLTMNLPNGEALTLTLGTAARRLFSLATYPLRISAGYMLFGWRGAVLIAVLSIVKPLREKKQQMS